MERKTILTRFRTMVDRFFMAWRKRLFVAASVLVLSVFITAYWFYHRSIPPDLHRVLFKGITYDRIHRTTPRPMWIHVMKIDTQEPGIRFHVTPGDMSRPRPLTGKLTTTFLKENKLQAAINGDFFFPWWSNTPFSYYPHIGDPVELQGFSASLGKIYSNHPVKNYYPTLFISKTNKFAFSPGSEAIYNAISGGPFLLMDGRPTPVTGTVEKVIGPRTAIGIGRGGRFVYFVVVDGRQPRFSEGCKIEELQQILLQQGAVDALNLDGGGSATMAIEGHNGHPEILNCPIDCHIPGRERPVANHLGVYAEKAPGK